MRIPSGVTDQYLYFVAVDSSDLITRETGLSSFTVYRSRNGAAAAAYTTPTVNETDATNMPGVYELLLDEDMTLDAGDQSQEVCLHITKTGMAPVTRVFELYRPSVTAGETIGVSSGAVSNVTTAATATAVTTVNGLAANVITAASMNADASAEIADAVWDEDATGHQTQGTFGQAIGDPAADTNTIFKAVVTDAAGANVAADIIAIKAETATILSDTNDIQTRIPAALVSGRIDASVGAMAADTLTASALAADAGTEIAAAVMASNVEGTVTLTESMRLQNAALLGKASGLGTTTAVFRDLADTKDRISATVDADGNRSAVTLDDT